MMNQLNLRADINLKEMRLNVLKCLESHSGDVEEAVLEIFRKVIDDKQWLNSIIDKAVRCNVDELINRCVFDGSFAAREELSKKLEEGKGGTE